ncbi:MAG: DUF982 domain-containing protein [Proteobacteria bacterium]|nr:DUF982 domain-containing protein [Pseudomonadota bacterium]
MMWWSHLPAVPVRAADNVGITMHVRSVEDAVEQMEAWPLPAGGKRGPKWRKAYRACFDALEGMAELDAARSAFEAAASEAGMLRRHG